MDRIGQENTYTGLVSTAWRSPGSWWETLILLFGLLFFRWSGLIYFGFGRGFCFWRCGWWRFRFWCASFCLGAESFRRRRRRSLLFFIQLRGFYLGLGHLFSVEAGSMTYTLWPHPARVQREPVPLRPCPLHLLTLSISFQIWGWSQRCQSGHQIGSQISQHTHILIWFKPCLSQLSQLLHLQEQYLQLF